MLQIVTSKTNSNKPVLWTWPHTWQQYCFLAFFVSPGFLLSLPLPPVTGAGLTDWTVTSAPTFSAINLFTGSIGGKGGWLCAWGLKKAPLTTAFPTLSSSSNGEECPPYPYPVIDRDAGKSLDQDLRAVLWLNIKGCLLNHIKCKLAFKSGAAPLYHSLVTFLEMFVHQPTGRCGL